MEKGFRESALREARENENSTKAKILSAAEYLFAKQGYKETTTRAIAERAGVNMAMLHYHWGTKEELWNAVYYDVITQASLRLQELVKSADTSKPRETVRMFITGLFDMLADNPNIPLLMQQLRYGKPWVEEYGGAPLFDFLAEYVKGSDKFDFDPVDPRLALWLIRGAMEFFFIRPELLQFFFKEEPEAMSEEFREKVIEAVVVMVERFGRLEDDAA